jgi:2-polyprenyl-3-methyl-5-hydroxy-6-metoxy-1,4-benzoquinol methylase
LNPQPSQKEIDEHYPKNYYSFKGEEPKKITIKIYNILFGEKNSVLRFFLSPLKKFIRSTIVVPHGKFLDVGCGSGKFLLTMKHLEMDCYGVEPGKMDGEFIKKHELKIYNGDLEGAEYSNESFDVISLSWVFEHVSDPSKMLNELFRILKPNGKIILSVPQSKSLMFYLFKKNWGPFRYTKTPFHLFS